jgi:hypothetical protein
MHRGRGVLISISPPHYNGFVLTVFSIKRLPAFTPEPVRRRLAGMKQVLLMIAVVMDQSVLTADFGVL